MDLSEREDERHHRTRAALREFVRNYEWIHTSLGLVGNTSFLVGSVFFLWESLKPAGTWLFIVGAFGMLVGSVGRAIVDLDSSEESG
ncbi:MAG: YrhK family protein [Actinomycetota bacterium]